MKISELKDLLEEYPDDYEVVLSKDSEGNDYSPLGELEEMLYVPDTTYSGDVYTLKEHNEEFDNDCAQLNAVVLWPAN